MLLILILTKLTHEFLSKIHEFLSISFQKALHLWLLRPRCEYLWEITFWSLICWFLQWLYALVSISLIQLIIKRNMQWLIWFKLRLPYCLLVLLKWRLLLIYYVYRVSLCLWLAKTSWFIIPGCRLLIFC